MSDEKWAPTEADIDEALDVYEQWLTDAFYMTGDKEVAIEKVTTSFNDAPNETFTWVAANKPDLIYDIDEAFPETA